MKSLGDLLKELRGDASLREASARIGISHNYLRNLEKGIDPRTKTPINPSAETLKKISRAYNYPYEELMKAAGYIDKDDTNTLPELTKKDEKDIAKRLESILESMENNTALAFDGEPMDEETKELVKEAIRSNLELTKKLAKKKFTPKKYRK